MILVAEPGCVVRDGQGQQGQSPLSCNSSAPLRPVRLRAARFGGAHSTLGRVLALLKSCLFPGLAVHLFSLHLRSFCMGNQKLNLTAGSSSSGEETTCSAVLLSGPL